MVSSRTLREGADQYLSLRQRQTEPGTYVNDRSLINRFVEYAGPNRVLKGVMVSDTVEGFLLTGAVGALRPDLTARSFNASRGRLVTFTNFCMRKGWIDHDPTSEVVRQHPPELRQRRFSATEMVHFWTHVSHPQERILVAAAANTALRISDITALKIGDADLATGGIDAYIHKTRNRDLVPITTELDGELRRWYVDYAEMLGRPLEPGMLLIPAKHYRGGFGGPGREYKLKPDARISRPDDIYKRVVVEAGLPFDPRNGFHTLRRSFARVLYDHLVEIGHGDPIRIVMAVLHHSNPETTMIYIGLDPGRIDRDKLLKGKVFLSALAADRSNVVQIRSADGSV